jgi:hypothetical protein
MHTAVGVFRTRPDAERAAASLVAHGIPGDRITVLAPGEGRAAAELPTTEAEAPGIGRTIGAVAGAAAGAGGGAQLGVAASLVIPGIGPVIALGAIGAVLLGVGGAAVGQAFDQGLREGIPKDEVYVYEDALRQGRSVVVALASDADQAEAARRALSGAGAESLDAAREQWWIGLRDAEAEAYQASGRSFEQDEARYRAGFEAAQNPERRGRSWDDVAPDLRRRHADACDDEAFRRGYERGRAYCEALGRQDRAA